MLELQVHHDGTSFVSLGLKRQGNRSGPEGSSDKLGAENRTGGLVAFSNGVAILVLYCEFITLGFNLLTTCTSSEATSLVRSVHSFSGFV